MPHLDQPDFIPISKKELDNLGWDEIDILLITGDAYIDHPSFGIALIGRLLIENGYRVGIIAQPDWKDPESLKIMGRPRIACGVSSGNLDSMLNIYTAGRRIRKEDAYSEEGKTGLRPPHAATVYAQLVRRAFSDMPVILGGLETSLRRIAHYDYWQDKLKPGILVESKADIAVYGMGEKPILEIIRRLEAGEPLEKIPGTVRFLGKKEADSFTASGTPCLELPSYEEIQKDRDKLMEATIIAEKEMNPYSGKTLIQRYNDRILIVEPPAEPPTQEELDDIFEMPFSKKPHPFYKKNIPAFATIKDSIKVVRGCPGGCSFCGIASHQGHFIVSRSEESVIREIVRLVESKNFKGTVSDLGGAAGNIYGHSGRDLEICKKCHRVSCLFPSQCPNYQVDEQRLTRLLRKVRAIKGVKHAFISSGIKLGLAVQQKNLMKDIIHHHVSGQLKVAPEHLHPKILKLMRKDSAEAFYEFVEFFQAESSEAGKKQYLVPLFISNFPGCTEREMKVVDDYLAKQNWSPQQVQDFIPLPMTMAAAMYYCEKTPEGEPLVVNRGLKARRSQITMLKRKRKSRPFKKRRNN
jgi:uncharacterized radical SAM protein YgiQ